MKTFAILFPLAVLAGCAGISVSTDWDTTVDFGSFRTFSILEQVPGAQPVNRFTDQRIRAALAADLTAKGFRQVSDRKDADLAFGYQVATEQRTEFQTIYTGWGGYGFGTSRYRGWGGHWGTTTTTRFDYTVGTLIVAAFDVRANELIWQSSGSGVVDPTRSADTSRERINDAIVRIMRQFPPPSQ